MILTLRCPLDALKDRQAMPRPAMKRQLKLFSETVRLTGHACPRFVGL